MREVESERKKGDEVERKGRRDRERLEKNISTGRVFRRITLPQSLLHPLSSVSYTPEQGSVMGEVIVHRHPTPPSFYNGF